jgi:predicted O-methyltransferase YrrM
MAEHAYGAVLLTLALSGGLFLLAIYWKVRRIHLATYQLLDDASATRREAEALFAQIQALLALERRLALPLALPPMRGWAGSPDFLLAIVEETLARKPRTVVECSSGVSTLVLARALQLNGEGHVYSLEHDAEYAGKTRELLQRYGLVDWATVLDAALERGEGEAPWYSEKALRQIPPNIGLLVIDGPPASVGPLARYPALPKTAARLAADALIILDDADREEEQEIVARWQREFPEMESKRLPAEKGLVMIGKSQAMASAPSKS